jgi:hypothetical protein
MMLIFRLTFYIMITLITIYHQLSNIILVLLLSIYSHISYKLINYDNLY